MNEFSSANLYSSTFCLRFSILTETCLYFANAKAHSVDKIRTIKLLKMFHSFHSTSMFSRVSSGTIIFLSCQKMAISLGNIPNNEKRPIIKEPYRNFCNISRAGNKFLLGVSFVEVTSCVFRFERSNSVTESVVRLWRDG